VTQRRPIEKILTLSQPMRDVVTHRNEEYVYNLAQWGKKKIAGDNYSKLRFQGSALRHAVNNFT